MFRILKRVNKRALLGGKSNRPDRSFSIPNSSVEVGVWDSGKTPFSEKYRFTLTRRGEHGRRYASLGALDLKLLPTVALKLAELFFESTDEVLIKKDLGRFISLIRDFESIVEDYESGGQASKGYLLFQGAADSDCGQKFSC